jgi:hypothetical protein
MSATGLAVFDETVQKTNIWLNEIAQMLTCDRHHAYTALRAVLHCLRSTNSCRGVRSTNSIGILLTTSPPKARPAGKPSP